MLRESLLNYYRDNTFNPVPIALEDKAAWELHFVKRRNLYERHLGIPLALLRDRSVLEFGCNSGENALVLASSGANLTLVEPNEQVLPRLRMLFEKFNLQERIVALRQEDMESFESDNSYELIIAEGFFSTLPNRDEMFKKVVGLLARGGLAVISFNDRYGSLLEFTRRVVLWRACQLAKIKDMHSQASLEMARQLYRQDFEQLNASRPFEAWWKDTLVNPFFAFPHLWSCGELLPLIKETGCEWYSFSPKWALTEHFRWYKNIVDAETRYRYLLDDYRRVFSFFLTGFYPLNEKAEPAGYPAVDSVSGLIARISEYTLGSSSSIDKIEYPAPLDEYLKGYKDTRLKDFNSEMQRLYKALRSVPLKDLISTYVNTKYVRNLWGVPYHYICFSKSY